ncbi:glycosyltransferase [Collinsella sp. AGMB00827]|uniref:Glycosyltransferase n=2 Tax=Collinsella ureilytica TaxID=2869515 RepID=A0ABS7MIC4_9ACTN|nr:glycosyltransferase [Collinsella urealyticum]
MPCYNVEAYLRRGLTSLSDPRFAGRLEVIVVDDGSRDGTAAIAREFIRTAPEIFRLVSKENGGHGSAVNAGLAAARGRYFRVLDGDDWMDTEGLDAFLNALANLHADLVIDRKREVDMVTGLSREFPLAEGVETGHALPFASVLTNGDTVFQIMIHTLTARTDYLQGLSIHLLERTFYEDYEYVVKASVPAETIAYLDIETYQYQVGNAAQSVSHTNYVKRWADHTRVVWELLHYLADVEVGRGPQTISGEALAAPARAYLSEKVHLLIDTHYNIALLFDGDRRRGRARAREFRKKLREFHPGQFRRGERRYWSALILNYLGISYALIQRIKKGWRS